MMHMSRVEQRDKYIDVQQCRHGHYLLSFVPQAIYQLLCDQAALWPLGQERNTVADA